MDLSLTAAEREFRDGLRAFLADNLTEEIRHLYRRGDAEGLQLRRRWQRRLHEAGYVGIAWPREYGGRGASPIEQLIFNEEMAAARAPDPVNVIAINMAGPSIIAHGTPAQKARYLEPMLSAEEIWCQGFSEPDSGSDLASLRTRAELDGDAFVVNGQKVWTSLAHIARWCILLTRSDPEAGDRHRGLTYLILDMRSPGVEVRPLRQMTGDSEFNEIYLTDVRVPRDQVLGEVGDGWRVAITTLMYERANLGSALQVHTRVSLEELLDTLRSRGLGEDPILRQQLADLYITVEAMRLNTYRDVSRTAHGDPPGPEGSIIKLMWSEVMQRLTEVAMAARGGEALAADDAWTFRFLRARGNSIEGGTSEILRNILAERVLGLPRSR